MSNLEEMRKNSNFWTAVARPKIKPGDRYFQMIEPFMRSEDINERNLGIELYICAVRALSIEIDFVPEEISSLFNLLVSAYSSTPRITPSFIENSFPFIPTLHNWSEETLLSDLERKLELKAAEWADPFLSILWTGNDEYINRACSKLEQASKKQLRILPLTEERQNEMNFAYATYPKRLIESKKRVDEFRNCNPNETINYLELFTKEFYKN